MIGLFSRKARPRKGEPPPDPTPPDGGTQPAGETAQGPTATPMPWLQAQETPLTEGTPPQASPAAPQGEQPAPRSGEQAGEPGLSADIRSIFTEEARVDPHLQGLASAVEDVDIRRLAELAREVSSLARRYGKK